MSEPRTIDEYLASLNAALDVGLKSRRRIFYEVVDHLSQAQMKQLSAGASPEEAERHAITTFGPPEVVAARFGAGIAGALDRRLARATRRLHRWTVGHAWRQAAAWLALSVLLAGVVAAVGAASGARNPFTAATFFLSSGVSWALVHTVAGLWSQKVSQLGMGNGQLMYLLLYPTVWSYLVMVDGIAAAGDFDVWNFMGYYGLVYATCFAASAAAEFAVKRAARRHAAAAADDRPQDWRADHPWRVALADAAPIPSGILALILVHPGPVSLRAAVATLVLAMTALTVGMIRLEQSRQEKEVYQRGYDAAV